MSGNKFEGILEKRNLHLLVLVSSLFLLLVTVSKSSMGSPEPSVYWYASELYWTFWPGLSLSVFGILLAIRNDNKYLGLTSVLLPVFYLYTLPSLIHEMFPVFDVYHVIPDLLALMEKNAWSMQMIPFPSSHLYQAASMMILNLDGTSYARLFPTILAFSIVLFIYAIGKNFSVKWAVLGPFMFLALNWFMEYHLARQGFGVMIWSVFWLAMFLYLEKNDHRLGALAGVILFSLVPSHPGTLIIISFNFAALMIVTFFSFRDEEERDYLYPAIPMVLIFGVSFAVFYVAVPSINEYINGVYQKFTGGGSHDFSLGGPSETSFQYAFVNKIRMVEGILQSFLGLLGIYTLYRSVSKRALFLGSWFFSCYLWLIYPLTNEGLYMERAFLFALIPASISLVALFKHFRPENYEIRNFMEVTAIVILAGLLLTVPITKNSIDSIETPSRPSYRAGRFTQSNMKGDVYVTDTHLGMFKYLESTRKSEVNFRYKGHIPSEQPYGYAIPSTDRTDLKQILFADYFKNYIRIRYGNRTAVDNLNEYEEEYSITSAKIYDSGGSRIYRSTLN